MPTHQFGTAGSACIVYVLQGSVTEELFLKLIYRPKGKLPNQNRAVYFLCSNVVFVISKLEN